MFKPILLPIIRPGHHNVLQLIELTTPEEELSYGPVKALQIEALGAHALRVTWEAPDILPGASVTTPPGRYAVYYTEVGCGSFLCFFFQLHALAGQGRQRL